MTNVNICHCEGALTTVAMTTGDNGFSAMLRMTGE
jgi:hypothetical protein